ncbi:hypothetical protein KKB11_06290 [Candidatus Micrarchaeota archaeon]|nr:hypothetical protein [Candidatus Micrarchaeota archaeon]
MIFEIDVSGSDIFDKDTVIMVAERNNEHRMLGFKMTQNIKQTILTRYGQRLYRYSKSPNGKAKMKVRFYCAVIYLIFRELQKK